MERLGRRGEREHMEWAKRPQAQNCTVLGGGEFTPAMTRTPREKERRGSCFGEGRELADLIQSNSFKIVGIGIEERNSRRLHDEGTP